MTVVKQGTELRAHVRGEALAHALRERGLAGGEPEQGLVLDVHEADPASWQELEHLLVGAYELSRRAFAAAAPVVYVLDEASLYGHRSPLQAMLATGLLGGMRSLAAEGRRDAVPAHAVTLDDPGQLPAAADAVLWLLTRRRTTGQVHHCGLTHVGRPAA